MAYKSHSVAWIGYLLTTPFLWFSGFLFFLLWNQTGLIFASAELASGNLIGCPEGTYFSQQLCLECPSGHFCPGNLSAAQRCIMGTFNPYAGKSSIDDCKPCFAGLITSEDRADCRLCPAGFSCHPTNGNISLCPPGEYSPEGILQCQTCPVDSVCNFGYARKCGPGKEANLDHTECQDCPPGFYSSFCTIRCLQCPAGSFCPDLGMSQPISCPPGSTSTLGQTSCHKCDDADFMCGVLMPPKLRQSGHKSSLGSPCGPGRYYKHSGEGSECVVCPAGYYCEGGLAIPCPGGSYGPKEGLQTRVDCTICPAGFYCLEGTSAHPSPQFLCPPGFFCEEGTATPHGSPCPAGTAGEQVGQTSRAACKRCSEGQYCPPGSSAPGLPCARGRFCPAGTLEEIKCPPGTFTPNQGAISLKDCLKCPAGFHCPEGASDPVPCPPGSFNPLEGQADLADCRECHAGKACTQTALTAPDMDCAQGFVCPPGSSKPNAPANACPPGTLSNRTDLSDRSQCRQCPARYACLRGTGSVHGPPLPCSVGHYCPPGTKFPTQYKCPAGTWSGQTGLQAESECQPCPQGWYCLVGSAGPSGRCNSGHYCPEGTAYGGQFPCPAGTYSIHMGNRQKEDCPPCPEGSFCVEGSSKPAPCPSSTFRRGKGGQALEDCSTCPAGYFCPESTTVNPRKCGSGSFSDEGATECSPCLSGHFCSNETTSEEAMLSVMACPPGYLCSQGLARDPRRSAALCPRGFYCPGGHIDPNPVPCPNGTYGERPGLSEVNECVPCPEGKYCYSQQPEDDPITSPTGLCPDGHYCPIGTGFLYSYPCQAGQYRSTASGHHGDVCVPCPSKHYCDKPGMQTPSICPQGFYCPEGSSSAQPCPEGSYGSRSGLSNGSECSPCGAGWYCSGVGLAEPSGTCKDGFYCRERAKFATPMDGRTGDMCPPGSYCPPASSSPIPCPSGTFSNSSGLGSPRGCVSCPPGLFCLGSNNTSPSGPCSPGYYCTGGSDSPIQHEAEEGHFTLERAFRPEPCPLGTFQPLRGARSCMQCQGGRLCNQTGLIQPPACPRGHYCPPATVVAHPCPPGRYSDQPGGVDMLHCRPCEAGWFCSKTGLSNPEGLCQPGHYCTSAAFTASPVAVDSGGMCPAGYVCPRGTKHPRQHPCPVGTWSNNVGAQNLSYCQLCPPGLYCNTSGLTQPSGTCDTGFYCALGASSPKPLDGLTGDVCPIGHYCIVGSAAPTPCPDGTYSNTTGAESCSDCPPGSYCLSEEGIQPCPKGHYCLGFGVEGILPCPPATYNPHLGFSQVEQCLICPAGFYCEDWGLSEPTGPCQAGYYCIAGVNFPNPDGNYSTGLGGACPRGKYCPEGTSLPLPCPPGTYSDRLYVADITGCRSCPPGHFCAGEGLTAPSGNCEAGFYCPGGDSGATGSEGGLCPPAHYCPEGSVGPAPCPAGFYANLTGQWLCSPCPAGHYCPEKTSDFAKFPCPPGFYCPDGTKHPSQYPCPRGYYNPELMTQSLDSCLPCPPGHYCEKEKLTNVSGKCKAGWFCVSAAWNSQPFDLDNYTNANCLCPATATGGRCQPGFYCPTGSPEPLPCPPGTFCNTSGLALPTGPCSPGYYCEGGAIEAKPTDGETGSICPSGAYCVEGSREPQLCPAGTFSPLPGRTTQTECRPCTGGFYCDQSGLSTPTGSCNQGYWCPPGQISALPCPTGHFCLKGSASPEPCPSGTYQDRENQAFCNICDAGYYCDPKLSPANGSLLKLCPKGHYCPAGTCTSNEHPCPVGSFNPREHADSPEGCMPCPNGRYCPSPGLSEPAGLCLAGFWCKEGASSPTPLDGRSGSKCPPGHYCPAGTTAPVACPIGSWSNSSGLQTQEDCQTCLGGFYCNSAGLTSPIGRCLGGYYCLGGAITPTPTDGKTGGPCPEGSYCPEGSAEPIPCEPGTYAVVTHATQCQPCLPGWYCVNGTFHLCPPGYYCSAGSATPQLCPPGTIGTEDGRGSCDACPRGFYCPGGNNASSYECPMGHYCPLGTRSKFLHPCPSGSINPFTRMTKTQDCLPCPPGFFCASPGMAVTSGQCAAGYYCSSGASSPTPSDYGLTGDRCPEGHYCPWGSSTPLPCPVGYYSNRSGNSQTSDCLPCPRGFLCTTRGLSFPSLICSEGSYCPSPNASVECPTGHMCPRGSHRPVSCLPGAFQNLPGQAMCVTCPAGFYCADFTNVDIGNISRSYTPTLCPKGHFCPPGSESGVAFPCPHGTFSAQMGLSSEQGCELCPPGSYCASSGLKAPTGLCSPGYFCSQRSISAQPDDNPTGGRCKTGFYCPQGTSVMLPCPATTFSSIEGAMSVDDCQLCLPGHYCAQVGLSSPSGLCKAGFFCTSGSKTATPYSNITGGSVSPSAHPIQSTHTHFHGGACPAGYYCLEGSTKPSPCPPGTFQGRVGAESEADCEACYAGSYCPSWGQSSVDLQCPPGWFCPSGAVSGKQPGFKCPTGHACPYGSPEPTICDPGSFQALPAQSACDTCPAGFYCKAGSSEPSPCPEGTVNPSAGRTGLSDCTPCPRGFFCNRTALKEPSGACSPGYFCLLGSPEPCPVSQPFGDKCPPGHFCLPGTESPQPCPVGSFLPEPGASSSSHCPLCPPGKYCLGPGASQPTGLCSAGFFCTEGAGSPTPRANAFQFSCLYAIIQEFYLINMEMTPWLYDKLTLFNNSYTTVFAEGGYKWVELDTPSDSPHIVTHSRLHLKSPLLGKCAGYTGDKCPKGFYCPRGSAYPLLCESGLYCNQSGLEAPVGPCTAGYYCPRGSEAPHGALCPPGHYCPLGTTLPLPCPDGTLQGSHGGVSLESCQSCPRGHYCHRRGSTEPSGQCSVGYYCPAGQSSDRPPRHVCPAGHYCEKGSAEPTPCQPGSYQLKQGQGHCETCPSGFYCQGTSSPLLCEKGFYCPSESATGRPCPAGSYGNVSGLTEGQQCSSCDPGMFCRGSARTFPSGLCAAGFVCVGGAFEPSPKDNLTGYLCPPGFYCSSGTLIPQPCPKGTFSEQNGLMDESQCRRCSPGSYCSETGLSRVSGPCLPGFYCLEGSPTAAPVSSVSGGACPAGHYCAQGSDFPSPCPPGSFRNETGGKGKDDCKLCLPGFYQDLSGQTDCRRCPSGFHCETLRLSSTRGSSSVFYSPLPCPAGFFCSTESPDGQPLPCPKGTYGPSQGLGSEGECLACPAGLFCGSEGLAEPSGWCVDGFLCLMGASVPNPTDMTTGSLCPPGVFCQRGLKAGDCRPGFYCDRGSNRADQSLCPVGFFCPGGTPAPIPCPAGTFSSVTGISHLSNCTECTAGYYCQGTGQPTLCVVGYYCPPGMGQELGFPCPAGTVQNQPGASSLEACQPCPAGMFCSQLGLSQPSGLCQAGYYCPSGSTSSNSSDYQSNSTRSHICPSGYFCPAGTKNPIPCPAGSFSISRGLKRVEDCLPCPPGKFCDRPASTDLADALPCYAGYVCLSGSPSPTPSDGSHGYPCPPGHSCPVGSAGALPCMPGTYSPAPGATECLVCPRGMTCSSLATLEPVVCPLGHYCPAGAALAQACPLGTFNNQTGAHSRSACVACPPGLYCGTYGASSPQGSCLEGFSCQSGAVGPAPKNADSFPENGPCPAGHFCPAGCLAPVPCPHGSIRNTTGGMSMDSCSTCPAGHYCSSEGLASPSGPCAAGFYCPYDFSSTTPYSFLCPKGHYCPQGSPFALPCPKGEYQPNPGSENCIPCRPGFFCEEAIVGEPQICPPHSFCPAGTMVPHPCPNGSYSDPNNRGLHDARECLSCPPGRFCRAGRIQGLCAAGYLCVSGSADFTPHGSILDPTLCHWGTACAGPCPPGFYCPEGTEKAVVCPGNTFRSNPGGARAQDCSPCPTGHWCQPGEPSPRLCPAGHYCNVFPGDDNNGWIGPEPCPVYTYRGPPGASSKRECIPCPPGSNCNSTGLVDYSNHPCPPGFWCTGYGPPIFCPAGTKRMLPGAGQPSQCEPCAGGTHCPDPQATGKPNVEGIPCRASYQCSMGSSAEKLCRAGSYCEPQTADPQICPAGYVCAAGSPSYHLPEQLCPFPFYCPANSSSMKSCDGGTKPVNTSGLRTSKNCSCSVCEGGTYRPSLSTLLECLPCPPGFFCPPGTDEYKTNPCPQGHVCPPGSTRPTPCPPGSFGNTSQAKTLADCHRCPADTFNHVHAQSACFPCGSSSTSLSGSSSCTCIGKNRAFHRSDGACVCRTGFIFYNELDFKSSIYDSALDCQPELYKRCAPGQVRLAGSRECVSPSTYSCTPTCGPHGGTLDVEMGICRCRIYVTADELCDTSCLYKMPRLSARFDPSGHLMLSIVERDGTVWDKTLTDVLGADPHAKDIGKIYLVEFDSGGVFGWIPKQREDVEIFLSESEANLATTRRKTTGDNEEDLFISPRIPNPIACLSPGDMLIFHLTINHTDRNLSHFPVYEKDHLFNNNPSWDFGVFRRVQTLIKHSNLNNSWFAHAFYETGKYVFVDSSVPDWSLLVVVSEDGTECNPRTPAFQAMTPEQLVKLGIIKQHRLNHLPEWATIAGLLSVLSVFVVAVSITALIIWPGKANLVAQGRTKPRWRSLGDPPRPLECPCGGDNFCGFPGPRSAGEGAEAEEPLISKGGITFACRDLEEFNVRTLYDKLEDQNLHVASQLARHCKDTQEFYRRISQQVEGLQNVFENMDAEKLSLLKQLLASQNALRDKPCNNIVKKMNDKASESTALLEAVFTSAEALLCKLNRESQHDAQDQGSLLHIRSQPVDAKEFEPQPHFSQNNTFQVSSTDLTQTEALPHHAIHTHPTTPHLSDVDLSKLVIISPLYKTLEEIHQSLQNPSRPRSNVISTSFQENPEVQLIPTALDSLSPQHSAIFLFAQWLMELLEKSHPSPCSVPLMLAKSFPISPPSADNGPLAHCREDFYFDAGRQVLYLSETKLEHVGSFMATVLQAVAHITSGYNNKTFTHALHDAMSVLSLELFHTSFKPSTAEGALGEEFVKMNVPQGTHFAEHLLAARWEKYQHAMFEQLLLNPTPSTETGLPPYGTPMRVSDVEEEIDRMNEVFLELSVQLNVLKTEAEDQSTRAAPPSPSRNGTILLEMKRRYVCQRLNELQTTLERIRQQQQQHRGGGSTPGTPACSGGAQRAPAESQRGTDQS